MPKSLATLVLVLFSLGGLSPCCFSQESGLIKGDKPAVETSPLEPLKSAKTESPSTGEPIAPKTPVKAQAAMAKEGWHLWRAAQDEALLKVVMTDKEESTLLVSAYKQWVIKYYERQIEILEEQKSVLRNTNIISNIVCVIVHIVLAICFWIALKEYHHGQKLRSKEPENTEVAVSLNALSIKTTRQGIVLLMLAMVLYFLYLTIVYPITVVG